MPQAIVTKIYNLHCSICGKIENYSSEEMQKCAWIILSEVTTNGLRLFEKPIGYRYESFNIPYKIEKTYCSKNCALRSLQESINLFLAEVTSRPKDIERKIIQ